MECHLNIRDAYWSIGPHVLHVVQDPQGDCLLCSKTQEMFSWSQSCVFFTTPSFAQHDFNIFTKVTLVDQVNLTMGGLNRGTDI